MNKQELIERIEDFPCEASLVTEMIRINKNTLLGWVKELDEPQKVTVPRVAADWYEEHKDDFEIALFRCIDHIPSVYDEGDLNEFEEWIIDGETKPFQTLVNMHQFGYEVEKEKLYEVKLKNTDDYLVKTNNDDYHFYNNIYTNRRKHTRKELEKAGFGDVFNNPLFEVKEVEE